jgi:hypothetical protein
MLMLATVGLKPCETTDGSNRTNLGCHRCLNPADSYDAAFDSQLCSTCATTHSVDKDTVGGYDV